MAIFHAIRSLLFTGINHNPHEKLLKYQRQTVTGISLLTWLMVPCNIFLRRYPKGSKYETAIEKVELLDGNPEYAFVWFPGGRESTVSVRDLALFKTRDGVMI